MSIEEKVIKYSDMVYKIAYTMTSRKSDADDIYQEVFIKLFEKNIDFDSEEHEKAWIIRVTINCCKMLKRKSFFKREVRLDDNIDYPFKEDRFEVLEYVKKLPIKYNTVIYLFYYEGYQINEIARILETSEGTVKSQLSRARKMLKESMKGDFDYE